MMKLTFALLFALAITRLHAQEYVTPIVDYCWGDTIAFLKVPSNFKEHNWHYGEGTMTTLTYPDSSRIFLHIGGNMTVPWLWKDDYLVYESQMIGEVEIRNGRKKGTQLFWREVVFSGMMNIGYEGITKQQIKAYDQSIDSFVLYKKKK